MAIVTNTGLATRTVTLGSDTDLLAITDPDSRTTSFAYEPIQLHKLFTRTKGTLFNSTAQQATIRNPAD